MAAPAGGLRGQKAKTDTHRGGRRRLVRRVRRIGRIHGALRNSNLRDGEAHARGAFRAVRGIRLPDLRVSAGPQDGLTRTVDLPIRPLATHSCSYPANVIAATSASTSNGRAIRPAFR